MYSYQLIIKDYSEIHSYYNSKSELFNYGKDQIAEEICKILNDIHQQVKKENEDKYNKLEIAG